MNRPKALAARLRQPRPLQGDGAWGTELFRRGLDRSDRPERWILTHPEAVVDLHRAYLEAGAEWIQTATFGASPFRLAEAGLEPLTETLNARAAALARQTVGDRAFLLGSVGPSGWAPAPEDPTWGPRIQASFERQIRVLAAAGLSGLLLETFTDLDEACLALATARRIAPHLPTLVTLVFAQGPGGWRTLRGQSLTEATTRLTRGGAAALGANCLPADPDLRALAQALRAATDLPLLIQPNAGLPEVTSEGLRFPLGPDAFAETLAELPSLGVQLLGGCCGAGPDHLRALAARLHP